MDEIHDKIVNFRYCNFCEHKNTSEDKEPCCVCLEYPTNVDSKRPLYFKSNGLLEKKHKLKESKNDNE